MLFTPAIFISSLIGTAMAAPISSPDQSTISAPQIARIVESPPPPGTVFVVPPPLFDPAEPRPDPLFDSSSPSAGPDSDLRTPPIQKFRSETLLPFDGAHVHPYATPYTPERLPGTCAYIFNCQVARASAEITATLLMFSTILYTLIYIGTRVIRRILWTAKARTRSPSGSLRLEPEIEHKTSYYQDAGTDPIQAPIVKVWCEKGTEKIIFQE
ncbi:MAG: hypothetical protein GOMPHAMPRED_007647 [Gomphillus americanus]|uniref:Uncharacterized protein n=1 Tax=Gomphillus americanus TaxID=1940652 RepID=A0A8H3EVX5_9LECA|nr:MAG: hypothetical protein GOMPHAMPRED_007647 [Gomphillus americanus]